MTRNETLKIRYQVYRKLGYNSATSRALSFRSLDVSGLEISKKTGKLKRNQTTKRYIDETMEAWKRRDAINKHRQKVKSIPNDTTYTRHGMMTHDKRYRGETGKIVTIIKTENRLTRDQAYYFYYFMNQSGLSYEETKDQLLSSQDFQKYDENKKARLEAQRKRKNEINRRSKARRRAYLKTKGKR